MLAVNMRKIIQLLDDKPALLKAVLFFVLTTLFYYFHTTPYIRLVLAIICIVYYLYLAYPVSFEKKPRSSLLYMIELWDDAEEAKIATMFMEKDSYYVAQQIGVHEHLIEPKKLNIKTAADILEDLEDAKIILTTNLCWFQNHMVGHVLLESLLTTYITYCRLYPHCVVIVEKIK